jgi:hypothetical protein
MPVQAVDPCRAFVEQVSYDAPGLAATDRHRPTARRAMDQASQKRRATDQARRRDLRISRFHPRLNGHECGLVNDRRHGNGDYPIYGARSFAGIANIGVANVRATLA